MNRFTNEDGGGLAATLSKLYFVPKGETSAVELHIPEISCGLAHHVARTHPRARGQPDDPGEPRKSSGPHRASAGVLAAEGNVIAFAQKDYRRDIKSRMSIFRLFQFQPGQAASSCARCSSGRLLASILRRMLYAHLPRPWS